MARKKRRDEDAVDKRLDQETDETLDEAAEDADALDEDDLDPVDDRDLESEDDERDEAAEATPARRGGAAVKRAKADADSDTKSKTKPSKTRPGKTGTAEKEKDKPSRRVGPIGRLTRFIREVVAELRKVIWPTRKELITYTTVVVIFVIVMLGIIALYDVAFARAMLWIFGSNTAEG